MDELLTVGDVAVRLDKSEDWVTRQARAGVIPARKFGRTWRFTRDDLAAYIERSAYRAPTAASASGRRTRRRIEAATST